MARTTKRRRNTRGMQSLDQFLTHELGDLLSAEKRFLKVQQSMVKEIGDPEIKNRVEKHIRETEGHIQRVGEAFRSINTREKTEKCLGADGIVEEYRSFKSEEKPAKPLLNVFDIASSLRAEHYEIAAYRSTIKLAEALGRDEVVNLLNQNLAEEESMAQFLESNSMNAIHGAMQQTGMESTPTYRPMM